MKKYKKKKRRPAWAPLARKILSDQEQRAILLAAAAKRGTLSGRRAHLVCDVLLNSGLRASELCNLKIKETPCHLGGDFLEFKGKGQVIRSISIGDRLIESMAEYIKTDRPKTLPGHVRKKDPNRLLFYNRHCKRYDRTGIAWIVKSAARAAGIGRLVSPHMFRHTWITNALDRGVPPHHVQIMAGHSDPRIMQRYTHLLESRRAGIGNLIDRHFDLADPANSAK